MALKKNNQEKRRLQDWMWAGLAVQPSPPQPLYVIAPMYGTSVTSLSVHIQPCSLQRHVLVQSG